MLLLLLPVRYHVFTSRKRDLGIPRQLNTLIHLREAEITCLGLASDICTSA